MAWTAAELVVVGKSTLSAPTVVPRQRQQQLKWKQNPNSTTDPAFQLWGTVCLCELCTAVWTLHVFLNLPIISPLGCPLSTIRGCAAVAVAAAALLLLVFSILSFSFSSVCFHSHWPCSSPPFLCRPRRLRAIQLEWIQILTAHITLVIGWERIERMDGSEKEKGKPVARDTQINCKLQDKLAWLLCCSGRCVPHSLSHSTAAATTTVATTLSLVAKNNSRHRAGETPTFHF